MMLEGFVIEVRISGKESANCGDPTLSDVHFAIAESPDSPRELWLVTELTPRLRALHPAWHMKRLKRLSRDKALVRISGWPLYDQEHLDRVNRNRLSPWEIHPVMKIEIWRDEEWVEFRSE